MIRHFILDGWGLERAARGGQRAREPQQSPKGREGGEDPCCEAWVDCCLLTSAVLSVTGEVVRVAVPPTTIPPPPYCAKKKKKKKKDEREGE